MYYILKDNIVICEVVFLNSVLVKFFIDFFYILLGWLFLDDEVCGRFNESFLCVFVVLFFF